MSAIPSRREIDQFLEAIRKFVRINPPGPSRDHCAGQRAWVEAHWAPPVAKAVVEQMREIYRQRHRKA
jgi:hypothetical protein